MIRNNSVVLVLGAGASAPYGFYAGQQLVDAIKKTGDEGIMAFREAAPNFSQHHTQEFIDALRMSGWMSIDRFIQRRPEFSNVGKVMIAYHLIPFEDPDSLHLPDDNRWYHYLYNDILSPEEPEELGQNRLSVITYNYDRSFEKFLCDAIRHGFGLSEQDAADHVSAIPTVHVHGTFGDLPGMGNQIRKYSGQHVDIESAINRLHIVSEDIQASGVLDGCHQILQVATHVVFLGFAFDPVNVSRLRLHVNCPNANLKSTAFRMEQSEIGQISSIQFEPHNLHPAWSNPNVDCLLFLRQNRNIFV